MKKACMKLTALLLSLVLALMNVPSLALAGGEADCAMEQPPEQYHSGGIVSMPVSSAHDDSAGPRKNMASMPSSYRLDDARLTPVRNQSPYGTCWAFAAVASAESILESDGLASNPDFSEWQLAYTAYTSEDGQPAFYLSAGETPYNVGGNDAISAAVFTSGVSPVWESQVPYNSGTPSQVYAPEYTLKSWTIAHKVYDTQDNTEWKTLLMEKGALAVSYFHSDSYINYGTTTSYYSPVSLNTNHAVTLVGWDDNYPAANFKDTPEGDGAWIIKNSWGAGWGDDGCFYISYYDKTLNMNASAFELMPKSDETMVTHDELGWMMTLTFNGNEKIYTKSVFTATGSEKLTTIGTYVKSDNTDYTIQIRTANPAGGFDNAWASPQAGTIAAAGYARIDLTNPVYLSAGQTYEVIFSYANPGTGTYLPVEFTPSSIYEPGQSFYSTDGISWTDLYYMYPTISACDTCIFVFTLPESAPMRTVTFLSQGGSAVAPMSAAAGALIPEPAAPQKTGCAFGGWYSDSGCTDQWDFANDTVPDEDITLYAKWISIQYTVTYASMGGSDVASATAQAGAPIPEPAAPARAGYTFTGWFRDAACTAKWNFAADTMPDSNLTLYAGWAQNQYAVTFDSRGGSAVASASVAYGALVPEPAAPAMAGYSFTGWYRDAACTAKWNFAADTMPESNLTLYAGWALNQYAVTFDSRGGSAVAPAGAGHGSMVAEPAAPARKGSYFAGWYREPSCANKWNFAADTVSSDITLYARWATQAQAATLSGITLSAGKLSSAFSPSRKSYTVYLDENTGSVKITPVKTYAGATLTINGRKAASKTVSVACGKSASLTVKVALGKKSMTVRLTVKRAKSANNLLSSLKASAGSLSPAFAPNVTTYRLTLPAGTARVKLTAYKASKLARITNASRTYTVKPGKTVTAIIKVKAQSGAVRTYRIYINRAIR